MLLSRRSGIPEITINLGFSTQQTALDYLIIRMHHRIYPNTFLNRSESLYDQDSFMTAQSCPGIRRSSPLKSGMLQICLLNSPLCV